MHNANLGWHLAGHRTHLRIRKPLNLIKFHPAHMHFAWCSSQPDTVISLSFLTITNRTHNFSNKKKLACVGVLTRLHVPARAAFNNGAIKTTSELKIFHYHKWERQKLSNNLFVRLEIRYRSNSILAERDETQNFRWNLFPSSGYVNVQRCNQIS